jgi:hypothetical protein
LPHAQLSSCLCPRRFVFLHGGLAGTPPPLAGRTHRCLARSLPFRAEAAPIPDRCHGDASRSPPLPLDLATEGYGFFDSLAFNPVLVRPRHRAGGTAIGPKANRTRTGHLATAVLGTRHPGSTGSRCSLAGGGAWPIGRIRVSIDSWNWVFTQFTGDIPGISTFRRVTISNDALRASAHPMALLADRLS